MHQEKGNTYIWILIVVLALAVIFVVSYNLMHKKDTTSSASQTPISQKDSPSLIPSPTQSTTTTKTDTSNQQIDKDMSQIQDNLNKLDTNQKNADQSLSNTSQDNY